MSTFTIVAISVAGTLLAVFLARWANKKLNDWFMDRIWP